MMKTALVIISSLFFVVSASSAEAKSPPPAPHKKVVAKKIVKKPVHPAHAVKPVAIKAAPKHNATVGSLNPHEKLLKQSVVARGKRHVVYQRVALTPAAPVVPPVISAGELAGLNLTRDPLALKSNVAYVMDQASSQVLFEKNANVALPIASVTKLMTAMVVVESHQDMSEVLEVTDDDVDREKFSTSRLKVGSRLTRDDMLHIALMASENRAASALGRNYPGGLPAFVAAMNAKAKSLGMNDTHYNDSTGLSKNNVASARDLAKLVVAAYQHSIIREYSTDTKYLVEPNGHVTMQYGSSNPRLTLNKDWDLGLQKTGYINEAGHCLVLQTRIDGRPVVMVFLDSKGRYSHVADAIRMRQWVASHTTQNLTRLVSSKADQS
ncbi:D-alanyl-D-alanine carboxypeptidase [Oxalobacteraceae bacterium CAVE-383]|nr:D-alanyl-D-alanine carboxypeptidase [Oxalobacteraceae bacterium CAVE-383]